MAFKVLRTVRRSLHNMEVIGTHNPNNIFALEHQTNGQDRRRRGKNSMPVTEKATKRKKIEAGRERRAMHSAP